MLGWDAINFFPPSLCGVRLQAKRRARATLFSPQDDRKRLSNANSLCTDINYTGRGTLSI